MSNITKPILLDETGKEIINAINLVANAIGESADYQLEQMATGIVMEESSNPAWTRLGNKTAINEVINQYGNIVIDESRKVYAELDDNNDLLFKDGSVYDGTTGNVFRHFAPLYYIVKTNENGKTCLYGSKHHLNGHVFAENLIGTYKGSVDASGKLRSIPNVASTQSKTMSDFWSAAQRNGNEYGLTNYNDHCKMIAMSLLHYGNANSDVNVGVGLANAGSGYYASTTGATTSLGKHSGTCVYGETAYSQVKLFGVEALWGQAWEFRPNIRFDGVRCIVYDGNIVSNTASGREFNRDAGLNLNSSYITKMALGERFDMIPTVGGGSSSTYYCDGSWSSSGGELLSVGGASHYGSLAGLSCSYSYNGFSTSYASIGARLAFKGDLSEYTKVEGETFNS